MITALRDLWWLLQSCRRVAILLLVVALVQQALQMANPLLLGRLVDVIGTKDPAIVLQEGTWLAFLMALVLLVTLTLQFPARHAMVHLTHRVKGSIICDAFEHLLKLPVSFHETRDTGNKTKIIQNGVDNTISLADNWFSRGLPVVLYYALSAWVLLYVWWPAGVTVGVGVPIIVALSVLCYRSGKEARIIRHNCYEQSESLLKEGIQNIATVQSFRMEESQGKEMRGIWDQVYSAGFEEMRFANRGFFIRNGAIVCSTGLVVWLGVRAVVGGQISAGDFISVLSLVGSMMADLRPLSQMIDQTITNGLSLRRLRELLELESDVQEKPLAVRLETCKGSLVFDHVTFRYKGGTENALEDFCLTVKPGSVVALVGPSGAGKSTAFKLARRFVDPDQGRVLLDGHDLRNLKLAFRSHLAIVSQEVEIFSGTIAENISFGQQGLSFVDIERAATMAYVDEFVRKLPQGYDTIVGERGLKLSGGQRQRLAIARALAAQSSIILFDEATSHLDLESEALIRSALQNLMGQCTLLLIAHRLPTIRNADLIVVMEAGRVVAQGNHESLSQLQGGLYQRYLEIHSA